VKLAVSNIAWPAAMDEDALAIIKRAGVSAIEIAPTRLWPEWKGASPSAARGAGNDYASRGLPAVAMQAILFGKPEHKLLGSDAERENLKKHLEFCADLASAMEARSLVLGAPKNRDLNGRSPEDAFGIAREFFAELAPYYAGRGVWLCLEANPAQYGCQFITNSADAGKLVRSVGSPGFGLHLDTACMHLAGEDIADALRNNFEVLRHFHVSEPFLGAFDQPVINHASVAKTLRELQYDGWVSLEMREAPDALQGLQRASEFLVQVYNGEN
jgi:D-psicose/D-tagatose/L-ribulose 3-epimerase